MDFSTLDLGRSKHRAPSRWQRLAATRVIVYPVLVGMWLAVCGLASCDLAAGHPLSLDPGRLLPVSPTDRSLGVMCAAVVGALPVLTVAALVRGHRRHGNAARTLALGHQAAVAVSLVTVLAMYGAWVATHPIAPRPLPSGVPGSQFGVVFAATSFAVATLTWYGRWAVRKALGVASVPVGQVADVGRGQDGQMFMVLDDGSRWRIPAEVLPFPRDGLGDDRVVKVLGDDVFGRQVCVTAAGFCLELRPLQ